MVYIECDLSHVEVFLKLSMGVSNCMWKEQFSPGFFLFFYQASWFTLKPENDFLVFYIWKYLIGNTGRRILVF